jgi:hypothetical protein
MQRDKTWVAVNRRPDHSPSVQDCYTAVLSALTQMEEPLDESIRIPDTIIFSHSGWRWFHYNPSTGTLTQKPNQLCTTEKIIQALSAPQFLTPEAAAEGSDERRDIVACFMQDIRDAKGLLTGIEYLTAASLEQFFLTGPKKKLGVLQRFVYPELCHGTDFINSEYLFHWNPVESVEIERRISRFALDRPNTHPSLKANVNPAIYIQGKINSATSSFSPSDSKCVSERVDADEALETTAASLCDYVATALESVRKLSLTKEGRGVSRMTLRASFSHDGGYLCLLGVSNIRFPGDSCNAELTFDLIPPAWSLEEGQDNRSFSTLSRPTSARNSQQFKPGFGPQADEIGDDFSDDGERQGGSQRRRSPHRRAYEDEAPVTRATPLPPQTEFPCPNCSRLFDKGYFTSLRYKTILHEVSEKAKKSRQALDGLIPEVKPVVKNRKHGDPPPPRPKSARTAASIAGVRAVPDDAPCFDEQPSWAEIPVVLRKLNINLPELARRKIWLERSVHICKDCATSFGHPDGEPPAEVKDQSAVRERESSNISRSTTSRPQSARNRVILDSTGIADRLVLTDLQKHHRQIRRVEREKYEMREVIEEVKAGSPEYKTDEKDLAIIERHLQNLALRPDPVIQGTSPDVSLSDMLQNELLASLNAICRKGIEKTNEMKPKGAPSGFWAPFPTPRVPMNLRYLDPETIQRDRDAMAGVLEGRTLSYNTLGGRWDHLTFARLGRAEQELLVQIVGADRDRPMDGRGYQGHDDGAE